MSNELIYTPYFYIIEQSSTGKRYAGSRRAKGCHPSELLRTNNGYFTSQKEVKRLLKNGEKFLIIQIITEEECGMSVIDYETKFLVENSIAENENWLNFHNNTIMPHNSQIVRDNMKRKYGVEYAMHSPEIREKLNQQFLKQYGKTPGEFWREKGLETLAKQYNLETVSNCFAVPAIAEKIKDTLEERYGHGVRNPTQIPGMKERKRKNYLQKHGVEHNLSDPKVRESINRTNTIRKNRNIVRRINFYLEENSTRAKDQGLHNNWKQSSNEYLKNWCEENKIEYVEEDFY